MSRSIRALPSVKLLWDGWATVAVLDFLRTTRVGCIGAERVPPEEEEEEYSEGEEGGPAHPRLYFSFAFPLFLLAFGAKIGCVFTKIHVVVADLGHRSASELTKDCDYVGASYTVEMLTTDQQIQTRSLGKAHICE